MAEQDVINALRENIDAFSTGDRDKFAATLADDAVYEELSTQRRVQGKEEVVNTFHGWKQAFPDSKGTIQNIFASGNKAVAEILWEGTHSGDMIGPGVPYPPAASGCRYVQPWWSRLKEVD